MDLISSKRIFLRSVGGTSVERRQCDDRTEEGEARPRNAESLELKKARKQILPWSLLKEPALPIL